MAIYTEELNTNYNFPNINIYNLYNDGVLYGYKAVPYAGYVMYDTNATDVDYVEDPETGEEIEVPVTYYYTMAGLSLRTNFDNFSWVAVPRDSVDENYIFGDNELEHEIM